MSGGVCIPLAEPARMSLLLIRTFGICFRIHTPRLRRTPLKRGLAVAVRLSSHYGTSKDTKDTNWVDSVDTNGAAAASPFERGATGVAGYVYR